MLRMVTFSGPYGEFYLRDTGAPILFIAGGSGMAPILSIVKDMKEKKIDRRAFYFFGAASQKDLFYVKELTQMQDELTRFTFVPALSHEPDDTGWRGERGLITEVVRRHMTDLAGFEAYLCGSPGMINACVTVLKEGGIPEEKIYFDKFE
jgi:Na+-transporting NADH:ubiquinone oxidoreductase subunit F